MVRCTQFDDSRHVLVICDAQVFFLAVASVVPDDVEIAEFVLFQEVGTFCEEVKIIDWTTVHMADENPRACGNFSEHAFDVFFVCDVVVFE
ncbi:MAG: hypothetical protein QG653_705 [Patescibacteria group bacterium]|nr:hypothetical protein [Patescibacteria group bacterium]